MEDCEGCRWGQHAKKLARALAETLRILDECKGAMLIAALHGGTCPTEDSERNGKAIEAAQRTLEEVGR